MTEWNASDYAHQSTLQQTMAEAQLAALTVAPNERVLDVGCGDGKVTAEIALRVPQGAVLGVDPSHDMIAFASQHFAGEKWRNLRFAVGDARELSFREEFTLVVSFNALHWVHEQEKALQGIRAALKPGGRALLRFVPEGERKCLEDVIEDTRQSPRWAARFASFSRPYAHFTLDEFRALAERSGLRVLSLQVEDFAWDFHTRAGFAAFCHATFIAWTRRLPESDVPAFIDDVLDRYRLVAATTAAEANTFKYYQLEALLGR